MINTSDFDSILRDFKIDATCINIQEKGHFVSFDIVPGRSFSFKKLISSSKEIALRLKAKSEPVIRMKSESGIVRINAIFSEQKSSNFENIYTCSEKGKGYLPFLFGQTEDGELLWVDIAQNPHMLVAGSTGSGKSVFLHTLIANAAKTKNISVYLSDPKRVEFSSYKSANFSFIKTVANTYEETIHMLKSIVETMEARYKALEKIGLRSIEEMQHPFNRILVILDEFADLILQDTKNHEFETLVIKLAQKARAAGIYLILATQRPDSKVITGRIKSNIEARLAFRVSSRVDSSIILDDQGAEKLIGKGDGLFKNKNHNLVRFQSFFTSANA